MAGTTKANNGIIALDADKRSVRRKLLMAGVMALAPVGAGMAQAQGVPAGCLPVNGGPTITCTGDQSNGLEIYQGNTLIVKSLTSSIGTSDHRLDDVDAGVDFDIYSNYKLAADSKLDPAAITLDVDTTGTSGIWVAYASGIEVENRDGVSTTTVKSKGDINVFDDEGNAVSGIAVFANTGKVDVTSASNITLTADGGEGDSAGIMVDSSGDIAISNIGMIATTNTNTYDHVAGIYARTSGMYRYDAAAGSNGENPGDPGNVGQAGDLGGAGGDITIASSGNITGAGQGAGIVAVTNGGQGGRGGQGGAGAEGDASMPGGNGGNGGAGGDGGRGGDVTVTASGAISQWGSWVTGIFASSTGGSGGTGGEPGLTGSGFEGSAATRGAAGNGGDAGDVTVVSSANIAVSGESATGIRAESSGGWAPEGGWEGSGGNVHVTNSGMIMTDGAGATGISVASLGGEMGSLTVDNSGTITNAMPDYTDDESGTGKSRIMTTAGVAFNGGYDNVLNNSGTIDSTGILGRDDPRFAVTAAGNTTVNNTGTINGSVDLIGLTPALIDTFINESNSVSSFDEFLALLHMDGNSFNNNQGGTFNAGVLVALGEGNTLTNSGVMSTGGDISGSFYYDSVATALIGNFNQTSTGKLDFNLDVANNRTNALYVLGDATLGGKIAVTPTNLDSGSIYTPLVSTYGIDTSSANSFPIIETDGVAYNGVTLLASPALHGSLEWQPLEAESTTAPSPDDSYTSVSLASTGINYSTVAGLTAAEQQVADHVQEQFQQQHPENYAKSEATTETNNDKLFLALLSPMELAQYKAALDQLTPSSGASSGNASSATSSQFTNAMLSCRQATGAYAYIREGQCSWAQLKQRVTDRSLTVDAPGSRAYVTSLSAGVQKSLGRGWFAGFGLGFAHDDISNTDHASSSGNEAMAGVVVKYAPGPISLALALDAGMGWNDNKRNIALLSETATASNTQNHFGAQLRAAYLLDHGLWYAKPMVDLNATFLNIGGYTETGSSSNLTVMDSKATILSVSPGIEFGGQFKLANGSLVRPYAKAGLTFFGDTSIGTTAHLVGTTGDFTVSSTGDRTLVDLTGGLDILATDGMTLRLNTESHFGATTKDIAASAKVGWSF